MWKKIANWAVTPPFLVCFGSLLLVFELVQRVAYLFGQRPQEKAVGWLQICLVHSLRVAGIRLEVERSPEVLEDTPYIFLGNHQSMFDIAVHGTVLFSNFPKYVSKSSLARGIPSISYNLRNGGNALIERSNFKQATEAIRKLGKQAEARNVSVVLYPEGTRARAGELGAFKPGGALALMEAAPHLPIVTLAIDNSWKLMRHNLMPIPFGLRIRLYVGSPAPRHPDEDCMALVEQSRAEIEKTLERWRSSETGAP